MRVFVTGATGFIGSALVPELLAAGHQVVGLTRSDEGAAQLAAAGAEPFKGTLEDLEGLKRAASQADAVIHLAFNHDFTRYLENCADDRRVIEALSSVLRGKRLIVTSGTGMGAAVRGELATEESPGLPASVSPRAASEEAASAAGEAGVNVAIVRLPQVHDRQKQGLVSPVIEMARAKGAVAYIGEGANRWAAGHVSDAARIYRLVLEKGENGARYHAVGEEGVSMRDTAEAIGRRLGLPVKSITVEESPEYFGTMAMFATLDMPASSALTQQRLGWTPTGPGMIEDLDRLELA